MVMTLQTKNSGSWNQGSKSAVSPLSQFLRHGKEPTMADLANFTFESVIFADGTKVKDITFEQLSDVVWNLTTKH
jgi:hypothetical protein